RRGTLGGVQELRAARPLRCPGGHGPGPAPRREPAARGERTALPPPRAVGPPRAAGARARLPRVRSGVSSAPAGRGISPLDQPRSLRRRRAQGARVATVVSACALAFAMVRIQIIGAEYFSLVAKENRLRPIVVRAPRGTVYDRHGRVVAENVVGYQVLLMPAPM